MEKGIRLIESKSNHDITKIEFVVKPQERTPKHYHKEFSESFLILSGKLEIGCNGKIYNLNVGDSITINALDVHYFHNVSQENCVLIVTVSPGNKNFERALLFSKNLSFDGLCTHSGTPKKFKDLALFVKLNNSYSTGLLALAQPVLNMVAYWNIRNGYLEKMLKKYQIE